MESLLLLVPLSVALVLLIIVTLAWAVASDQFDFDRTEAERILDDD